MFTVRWMNKRNDDVGRGDGMKTTQLSGKWLIFRWNVQLTSVVNAESILTCKFVSFRIKLPTLMFSITSCVYGHRFCFWKVSFDFPSIHLTSILIYSFSTLTLTSFLLYMSLLLPLRSVLHFLLPDHLMLFWYMLFLVAILLPLPSSHCYLTFTRL